MERKRLAKFAESASERWDRFQKVQAQATPMRSTLETIYDYVAPSKVNFHRVKDQGEILTAQVYNSIPIAGVRTWANNVQSILMPPFQRWFKLTPGNLIAATETLTEGEKQDLKEKLEKTTELLFDNLNQSNFYNAINESLQDLAVSTGVIAINEQKGPIPFTFTSIPIDQVYFEEGEEGNLTNFWRSIYIKARFIRSHWPNSELKISSDLDNKIKSAPDEEVKLIEGVIKYPQNPEDSQYFHYVQDEHKNDLLTEFREYNPFIGFRVNKRPGDTYGYSVAQEYMPDIRVLNLISLYILKAAKFKAFPAFLATNSGAFNPFTAVLEPGSIIPVNPDFYSNPPIAPLETGGDPNFAQMSIQELENRISKAFLINPLGDVEDAGNRTATEMQLRQQNWVRENAAGIGRLASELIKPIISTCLIIMRKTGMISDLFTSLGQQKIAVDNKMVWVDYKSPLLNQQDQQDFTALINYIQTLVQLYGPSGLATLQNPEIITYLAEKSDIPLELLKDQMEIKQIIQQVAQAAQQPSLAQQKLQELAGEEGGQPQEAPGMPQGEI